MKKINVLPYVIICLLLALSSCSSEDQTILDLKSTAVEIDNETAFGYHNFEGNETDLNGFATCFDNDGFNRWGWTVGPFIEVQKLVLYAGAGQCDIDKGVRVGGVSVRYNHIQKRGTVRFRTIAPYVMTEAHAYVGSAMYPTNKKGKPTVAPGQYPFKNSDLGGVNEYIFPISDIPDDGNGLYVIAHAVVSSN